MVRTSIPTSYFGHKHITRKVVTSLMDWLTSRIFVEKYDNVGVPNKYINVPINYATQESFWNIVKQATFINPNSPETNKVYINNILPRMAINIVGMSFSTERAMNKTQKISGNYDASTKTVGNIPTGVPWNLDIELSIMSKTIDDNFQIIEQILPYFNPTLALNLNVIDGFEPESIKFSISSVTPDTNEEFGFDDDRVFISIITIQAKLNYYYVKYQPLGFVKEITTDYFIGKTGSEDYNKFLSYELRPDNLTPVTDITNRINEPTTSIIYDQFFGIMSEGGLYINTEDNKRILLEQIQ